MNEECDKGQKEKKEKWIQILSDWRKSDKSVAQYCKDSGIAAWKFHYWKKRLQQGCYQQDFVELSFNNPERSIGITLELTSKIKIILSSGFDSQELRRTINALSS